MASISEPVEQWTPRQDYLRDDDYFMALALLTGQRSTHPDKQVGACIVKDNKVIAVGYHQVVKEGADVQQGRPPTESEDQVEYHAETDAIIKGADVHGCTMFVTEFPCCQCMKVIIQAGNTSPKGMTLSSNVHKKRQNSQPRNKKRTAH
ncbi:deoxycytidylate deaminase-like [Boleophthalmus pectinirostris]|uniref:deoxycytidylate deaminase-like n=1 Tax=Boleophthalmus pectinirostris TaxID=150288 RepID=UPI002431E456|nr:deoxycytidylate deaminase-like [Boleophthalmus pectinirostris]